MADGVYTDLSGDKSVRKIVYTLTTADPNGSAIPAHDFQQKSIQADGTFGAATVVLDGSNDGVNFYPLTNSAATAIGITVAGLSTNVSAVQFIRPRLSVVGVGASVVVCIVMHAPSNRFAQ
jgi:hypothetical protein